MKQQTSSSCCWFIKHRLVSDVNVVIVRNQVSREAALESVASYVKSNTNSLRSGRNINLGFEEKRPHTRVGVGGGGVMKQGLPMWDLAWKSNIKSCPLLGWRGHSWDNWQRLAAPRSQPKQTVAQRGRDTAYRSTQPDRSGLSGSDNTQPLWADGRGFCAHHFSKSDYETRKYLWCINR